MTQQLTINQPVRITDEGSGWRGAVGFVEDTNPSWPNVLVRLSTGARWVTEWFAPEHLVPGAFVAGAFVPDARDVPGGGHARDVVVEGIERATGLNGRTLLEQLHDQGLTVVARDEVRGLRRRIDSAGSIVAALEETIENDCDDDEPVCHGYDRTDDGKCSLIADLERVRGILFAGGA